MSDKKSLPILTGSNFISWKICIKGYCMQHGLSKYFESTTPLPDPKLKDEYKDKLLKLADISTFLDDLDARLSKMAAVGLIIGTPGDLSDLLAAEIILHKIPNDHAAIKAILHGRRLLTVDVIKEALDNKRQEASSSVSASAPTIKQELSYKWPTCNPGWHNPATKHSIEECRQAKRRQVKPTPAARPAV
ncbi:uncharacterized protein VP01_159g1 [Puccinia sorghi]|uniref:Uncharacterized protein n=1 Tax=Puccinia sorghi TaxID=27349 RepID=A0A0L6VHX6_9BASI|nr:uncharacterized protein VP01_159g1 [Puccinia sorghi]